MQTARPDPGWAVVAGVAVGLAGVYGIATLTGNLSAGRINAAPAGRRSNWRRMSPRSPAAKSPRSASPRARSRLPDLAFKDAAGKPRTLADWRGRTVLLNLWATWCVPCRKEMPALDALQKKLGGPNFEVVAINIDTRDPDKPKAWLKEVGISRLTYYADPNAKVFQDLKAVGKAFGMPTTLLIDPNGCEIGTIAGPGRMGERRRGQAD